MIFLTMHAFEPLHKFTLNINLNKKTNGIIRQVNLIIPLCLAATSQDTLETSQ